MADDNTIDTIDEDEEAEAPISGGSTPNELDTLIPSSSSPVHQPPSPNFTSSLSPHQEPGRYPWTPQITSDGSPDTHVHGPAGLSQRGSLSIPSNQTPSSTTFQPRHWPLADQHEVILFRHFVIKLSPWVSVTIKKSPVLDVGETKTNDDCM